MEPDTKIVLDAWRELLVENAKLQEENQHLKRLVDSVQLAALPTGFRERGRKTKGDYCED